MNATEKRIRKIAVALTSADAYNDIVEVMHTIAYYLGDYSDEMNDYFNGLCRYIDSNDRAFKSLTGYARYRVETMGAHLILDPHPVNAVHALVRLHSLLGWADGDDAMMALTDKLYTTAEKNGVPTFKED